MHEHQVEWLVKTINEQTTAIEQQNEVLERIASALEKLVTDKVTS